MRVQGGPARRRPTEPVIVGRDAERGLLSGFLDAGPERSGDADRAGRDREDRACGNGRPRGRPAPATWCSRGRAGAAEARLPWVGLTDLLRTRRRRRCWPGCRRRSGRRCASSCCSRSRRAGRRAGRRHRAAVGARGAGPVGPVLIALDDLPYLDAASAGALRFALRRLEPDSRVRLIATARGEGSRWAPLDGLPGDQVLSVAVGPVTVGALFELLAGRLAVRLTRPVLLRVHATSGGNPLYALELARALDRLEIVVTRPGVPLPVPDQPRRAGRRAGPEPAARTFC